MAVSMSWMKRLSAVSPVDFERQAVDAAVRSAGGGWPGLEAAATGG